MSIFDYASRALKEIDGYKCYVYYDEDGTELRTQRLIPLNYIPPPSPLPASGVTVSQYDDPTRYQREYYRLVRSKRDGRVPRGPYKKNPISITQRS